uniref:TPX2 C-terminal domain-containing protein n=1 Tax=Oryza meridionalis TaxID=40149 RepID=A0A0E0FB58_9ORYZ
MGADLDFSPPPLPPEPALSPEPEILAPDHQSWKAEMMSALGESVSFGRFLAEPLEWGKWSAFAHNRYLEEAAHQSRPGSVAQKKAFFEAHYARKRKTDATGKMEELDVITDGGVGSSCGVDADGAAHRKQDGVHVGESREVLQAMEKQEAATHDPCADNSVPADADDKQPLKESSIVNQGSAESVKRRRLPSLLQKPAKFSSPSSGSKGPASSAKRRSRLHSSKENSSPPNNECNQQATSSVPQNRSILEAFQKSKNFGRCETGNAASSSKNLGTTIAARISQLESATGLVKHTDPALSQVKPPIEAFPKDVPDFTSRTSQLEEQRSSHVTRVKEKLFGFTSQSAHQKANTPRKEKGKTQNESFKARPLPNFYRRNKQAKDSSHQMSTTVMHTQQAKKHPKTNKYVAFHSEGWNP